MITKRFMTTQTTKKPNKHGFLTMSECAYGYNALTVYCLRCAAMGVLDPWPFSFWRIGTPALTSCQGGSEAKC